MKSWSSSRSMGAWCAGFALLIIPWLFACQETEPNVGSTTSAVTSPNPDAAVSPVGQVAIQPVASEQQADGKTERERAFVDNLKQSQAIVVAKVTSVEEQVEGVFPNGETTTMRRLSLAVEQVIVKGAPELVGSTLRALLTYTRREQPMGTHLIAGLKQLADGGWFIAAARRSPFPVPQATIDDITNNL